MIDSKTVASDPLSEVELRDLSGTACEWSSIKEEDRVFDPETGRGGGKGVYLLQNCVEKRGA